MLCGGSPKPMPSLLPTPVVCARGRKPALDPARDDELAVPGLDRKALGAKGLFETKGFVLGAAKGFVPEAVEARVAGAPAAIEGCKDDGASVEGGGGRRGPHDDSRISCCLLCDWLS